jgi:DNA-binding transcriptional ArsR family regulator
MYRGPFFVAAERELTVSFELAPTHNVLLSMMVVGSEEPTANEWVEQTAHSLKPDERHRHRLVFEGLGEAITPTTEDTAFEAYLAALANAAPRVLRDRVVDRFASIAGVPPTSLLADADTFIAAVARAYGDARFDRVLWQEVHSLLIEPSTLHDLVVAHLGAMWERVAPEWRRHQATLASEVRALRARIGSVKGLDAVRNVLGADVPEAIRAQLDGVERVVVVPSPHAGPLAMRFGSATTTWLFVQAGAVKRTSGRPPAKREELVGPLAALADSTRLHILELLAQGGPTLAQELLAQLDVSQPSLSRHLKQLTGTGYVTERRDTGANKRYEFNSATLEWTFRSLTHLLRHAPPVADETPDVRDAHPDLRRYLDRSGRIVLWPPKRTEQHKLHVYLAGKFEAGREYTEREVNDVLQRWSEARDHVTLRRDMYDLHLLERTRNGARYWKGKGE